MSGEAIVRSATAQPRASGQAGLVLLVTVGLTVAMHFLPQPWGYWVGWPLLLLSTYAHEMCHGLAALLVGGHFQSFRMWPDASGVAQTAVGSGAIARAVVSGGGLVGPALFAGLLFALGSRPRLARAGLLVFGLLLLASDVLVVRNPFGLAYVGLVGALLLLAARRLSPGWARGVVLFLAAQLSLSVFSRADYLFTRVARTSGGDMPSDVENMAQALGLPWFVWGAVCGGLSVLVLAGGVWLFLRTNRGSDDHGR